MAFQWWVTFTVAAVGGSVSAAFVDDSASLLQVADMAEQAMAFTSPGAKEIPTDQLLAISPPRSLLTESYVDLVNDVDDGGGPPTEEEDEDVGYIADSTEDDDATAELFVPKKDDTDTDMKEIYRMSWPQPSDAMRPAPVQTDSLAQKSKPKGSKRAAKKTHDGKKASEVPIQHLHTKINSNYDAKTAAREKRQLKHMHILAIIILIIFAVTVVLLTVLRACIQPEPSPFLRCGRTSKRSTSGKPTDRNSSRRSSQFASAAPQPVKAS